MQGTPGGGRFPFAASGSRLMRIENGGDFCLKIGARRELTDLHRKICSQTTATLRYAPLTLRLTAPVNGLRLTGAPGHGEHRGQRWGVLRQTQGRRTWASLGEAVFRQILQGGALSATILQRGRSQFPYPLKGGRQQSLRTVLGGGPSGPPPLLTSTSLGRRSQWGCGAGGNLPTGGILGGLFSRAARWPDRRGDMRKCPAGKCPANKSVQFRRPRCFHYFSPAGA